MIVKVQLTYMTTAGAPQVMIYDRARDHFFEGDATPEILKAMGIKKQAPLSSLMVKKYFNARYDKVTGNIELLNEVNFQNW